MTNSTEIHWEVAQLGDSSFSNPLSLHTHAWAVKTFGGRRYVPVAKRGEDVVLPGRTGRRHVDKTRESQLLSLSMWMVPLNEDGTVDDTMSMEKKLHQNWLKMLRALDADGQILLKKRWYEDGVVHSAVATAEFAGGMEGESSGFRQEFQLDFVLADPFFYESTPLAWLGSGDITVAGDVRTDHVVLEFIGGTDPKVVFPGGNYIRLDGTVTDVTVDCLNATAIRSDGRYVNGLLSHNPSKAGWPNLNPGAQHLTYTGGGSIKIAYDSAWR